jgi:hypothetical protein
LFIEKENISLLGGEANRQAIEVWLLFAHCRPPPRHLRTAAISQSGHDRASNWVLTVGLTVARASAEPDPSRYEGSRLNREARISFQLAKSVIPAASPMMQDLGCSFLMSQSSQGI